MKSRSRATAAALLFFAVALESEGCGFHLQGRGTFLSPSIQSIGVPPFINLTKRPELAQRITEQILRQLQVRSRRRTSASTEGVDAVLVGEVATFREAPVEYNPDGRARTIEVVITARARLLTTADKEVVWAADNFRFRQAYPVGVQASEFVEVQTVALEIVARDFAEAVVTSIVEGF